MGRGPLWLRPLFGSQGLFRALWVLVVWGPPRPKSLVLCGDKKSSGSGSRAQGLRRLYYVSLRGTSLSLGPSRGCGKNLRCCRRALTKRAFPAAFFCSLRRRRAPQIPLFGRQNFDTRAPVFLPPRKFLSGKRVLKEKCSLKNRAPFKSPQSFSPPYVWGL